MKKIVMFSMLLITGCVSSPQQSDPPATSRLAIDVGALDKARELMVNDINDHPANLTEKLSLADLYHRQHKFDLESQLLLTLNEKSKLSAGDRKKITIMLMRNELSRGNYKKVIEAYDDIMASDVLTRSESTRLTNQQHGKILQYLSISYCKLLDFDKCLTNLDTALYYLPGNTDILDNIHLAYYMKSLYARRPDIQNLYTGYNDTRSVAMLSNLVLALIYNDDEGKAYQLLTSRYSSADAIKIIDDLKKARSGYVKTKA